MRRNGALAEDYARRHGVARWYDSAEALIADPGVDAVYIATPPDSHCAYALAAAAAGKPALVEKPMARNTAECDRMVDAFARAGLPLFVAHYYRSLPCCVRVAQLLREGAVGTVTGVTYRMAEPHHKGGRPWRVEVPIAGSGHFLDVGSHALDLLDHLLGPLSDVSGGAANLGSAYEAEDTVALTFRAPNGALGAMAWNFASAVHDDLMQIAGTEGELSFRMYTQGPVTLRTASGTRQIEVPFPEHVAQPFIQSVVDDLLGSGTCPSTGESARRTSRVMDQVLGAYYGGREDGFWSRPDTWPGRRRT
jgi:predicted dehydrogenase